MKLKELMARVVESLAPVVSIVICGSVFYGVIYFLFGWKGIEWSHPAFWVNQLVRGCGTADVNDWVGRWSVESNFFERFEEGFEKVFAEQWGQEVGIDVSTTYEFNGDGTFESKVSHVIRGKGLSLSGGATTRGSYTLDGDRYLIEIGGSEDTEVWGYVMEEVKWTPCRGQNVVKISKIFKISCHAFS